MITKSPYGFGYGHKGRIAGTEPENGPKYRVHKPDPQPVIDMCLHCTKKYCYGECENTPEGKRKKQYKRRVAKEQLEKQRIQEEIDRKETEAAKTVADMVLIGWCEPAIAREKGLSVGEVKHLIKIATKKGFLY